MTQYHTANKTGILFVHSVWSGSWFIAVKIKTTGKIIPFSPYMHKRFKSLDEAEAVLSEYADVHGLQIISN